MRSLRLLLLFASLCPAHAQQASPEYFLVKSWRLTGTWSYTKHYQTVQQDSSGTVHTHTYDATVQASAEYKLVQAKGHTSRHYLWEAERGAQPNISVLVKVTDSRVIKPKQGKESWVKEETLVIAPQVEDSEASLRMDPLTGAYEVHAGFMNEPSGYFRHTNSGGGSQEVPVPLAFSTGAFGCHGKASGMTLGGVNGDGTMAGASLDNPAGNLIQFTWALTPWDKEPEGEATFDYADQDWIPEPGSGTTLQISWKGKAERVRVTLSGISRQPGTCLNSKEEDKDEDLVIEKQGKWEVQKEGEGENLKYIAYQVLPKDAPKSLKLELKARDYAPFGKLRCEVLLDGKWRNATQTSTGAIAANVPYDLDGVHIAEAWKKRENAGGLAATWDEAKVAGQASVGDGLSLYEEYRGLFLGSGSGSHQRLKPREKNLLVVDESGIFDTGLWKAASGITAHRIPRERTRAGKGGPQASRIVNPNSSFAKKGDKYAVVVTLLPDTKDDGTSGEVNMGVKSPKDVQFCRVYHGSLKAYVEKMRQWLTLAVMNPRGMEADYFRQAGLPERLWKRAAERLGETTFDKLLDQQLRWTALHEMGHACGLPGHTANPTSVTEVQAGDTTCYMRYSEDNAGMFYIILQTLFKPDALSPMDYSTFCKDTYNCYGALNVNDSP